MSIWTKVAWLIGGAVVATVMNFIGRIRARARRSVSHIDERYILGDWTGSPTGIYTGEGADSSDLDNLPLDERIRNGL